jgi:DNA-binding NarL/FixJ family response regulator
MHNWVHAVQTYRASVDVYRRVLGMRARRELRPQPPAADRADPRQAQPRCAALAELTPREREVALLMARGFTNQQIAAALVITSGTAANHAAHVIAKMGVLNRTQVAAAVAGLLTTNDHAARAS